MPIGEIKIQLGSTPLVEITIIDAETELAKDVSGLTVKEFLFQPPNVEDTFKVAADFSSDGTDGKVKYVPTNADFNVKGNWFVQFMGNDGTNYINLIPEPFTVLPNLEVVT